MWGQQWLFNQCSSALNKPSTMIHEWFPRGVITIQSYQRGGNWDSSCNWCPDIYPKDTLLLSQVSSLCPLSVSHSQVLHCTAHSHTQIRTKLKLHWCSLSAYPLIRCIIILPAERLSISLVRSWVCASCTTMQPVCSDRDTYHKASVLTWKK